MPIAGLARSMAVALALVLGACTTMPPPKLTDRLSRAFTPDRLVYCYDHGCETQETLTFSSADWARVRAAFAATAANPVAEREQVRAAVAVMEQVAGAQAGTWTDIGGTIPEPFNLSTPQLDCYDEAINTSNFLGLLGRDGLLRQHKPVAPVQRTLIAGDLIHATAVLEETASGKRYVIDSWFYDNGVAPSVVPLETWLAGWRPDDYVKPFNPPWASF